MWGKERKADLRLSEVASFVLLIVSFLQPIETRVFINQQHMHFVGTKEKVIQSKRATEVKELPILNLHKKELITTACEQLSSTEGAPTVTRSLVSLWDSFDLEQTYFFCRKRDIHQTRFPVLS